jgi:hypothetical protein
LGEEVKVKFLYILHLSTSSGREDRGRRLAITGTILRSPVVGYIYLGIRGGFY